MTRHEPTGEAARQDAQYAGSHPLQRGRGVIALRKDLSCSTNEAATVPTIVRMAGS